ncbi:MAG: shikimate kinase [Promethearchaeota archaeon]|jgi:shikimate kinase
MTKDSIALIGFMATGKTIIGKELAKQLGNDYQFIETDQIIIKMAGKSITRIFKEEGEPIFRRYEIDACKKVSKLKKAVISCGGGVVLNEANIRNLKKNCHIVLLIATVDEIYSRIMRNGKKKRPLVDKENPKKEIENILQYREPFYRSAAYIIIDTTKKEIIEVVHEIITKTKINE